MTDINSDIYSENKGADAIDSADVSSLIGGALANHPDDVRSDTEINDLISAVINSGPGILDIGEARIQWGIKVGFGNINFPSPFKPGLVPGVSLLVKDPGLIVSTEGTVPSYSRVYVVARDVSGNVVSGHIYWVAIGLKP